MAVSRGKEQLNTVLEILKVRDRLWVDSDMVMQCSSSWLGSSEYELIFSLQLEGAQLEAKVNEFTTELEDLVIPLTVREQLNVKIAEARERIKEWGKKVKANQGNSAVERVPQVIKLLQENPTHYFVDLFQGTQSNVHYLFITDLH